MSKRVIAAGLAIVVLIVLLVTVRLNRERPTQSTMSKTDFRLPDGAPSTTAAPAESPPPQPTNTPQPSPLPDKSVPFPQPAPPPAGERDGEMSSAATAAPDMPAAPAGAAVQPSDAKWTTIRVFYGTSRVPNRDGKTYGRENDIQRDPTTGVGTVALHVGVCEVTVPTRRDPGTIRRPLSAFGFSLPSDPARHFTIQSVDPIADEAAFRGQLKSELKHFLHGDVLLFVHGFNNSFEDGAYRTAQLVKDLEYDGAAAMYSWPSYGSAFEYQHDSEAVGLAVPSFTRFVEQLRATPGVLRIHLIAHSMGNRLVMLAANDLCKSGVSFSATERHPFTHYVMAAPDVNVDQFRTQWLTPTRALANTVTLLASSDDLALRESMRENKFQRLGQGGRLLEVFPGIVTIDATGVDSNFIAHAYWGDRIRVIEELHQWIVKEIAPAHPPLYLKHKAAEAYWSFIDTFVYPPLDDHPLKFFFACVAILTYAIATIMVIRRYMRRRRERATESSPFVRAFGGITIGCTLLTSLTVIRLIYGNAISLRWSDAALRQVDYVLIVWLLLMVASIVVVHGMQIVVARHHLRTTGALGH